MSQVLKDTLTEAGKVTPPAAVVANAVVNGWTMTHTAAALTIVYLVMQIGYLGWKWRNERADRRALKSVCSTSARAE